MRTLIYGLALKRMERMEKSSFEKCLMAGVTARLYRVSYIWLVWLGFLHSLLNKINQLRRGTRLLPEEYVHSFVFLFRLRQPADYNHRNLRIDLAEKLNELRSRCLRHDVIGDDYADLFCLRQSPKKGERSIGAGGDLDL